LGRGTVVDAFCYGGGWGVSAAVAGAQRVIFIDASEAALAYARRNAERNGVADRCVFLRADLPEALQQLAADAPVAAVVVDPPAFVKRKKDLEAGTRAYQKLNERALALLDAGGVLVSCSCSQHIDRDAFQRIVQRAARRADRDLRLLIEGGQSPDHPVHPAMPETRYLKALLFAVGR
jgi:23S rRNA (cytosine1962-C5)-methyltransferase